MQTKPTCRPARGDSDSPGSDDLDAMVALAYQELRSVARRQLAKAGGGATLDTTELVHEAYLKLANNESTVWRDQSHFRAVASVAMRHILVDRARARATSKHGGGLTRVSLDGDAIARDDDPNALLAVEAALVRVAAVAPRLARIVELRFYGGLSDAEIAEHLGLTIRTVQRDWTKARMLIQSALEP